MDIVTFGQAQKLYALGYEDHHCIGIAYNSMGGIVFVGLRTNPKDPLPVPSYVEALEWLEREKAMPWISIYAEDDTTMENVRTWVTWIGPKKLYSAYPTASDLLDALLEKEAADDKS